MALVKFHDANDRSKRIVINGDAVAYAKESPDNRSQTWVWLRDVNQNGKRDSFQISGTLDQVIEAFQTGVSPT